MKNLTRKLMLSIVAIALVVIALGTSTFAWFTLSNKASVGQFNAEVTAGEGMELSLDGTTWYSAIPADVMNTHINTIFTGLVNGATEPILSAVSTTDPTLLAFTKLKTDHTTFEAATANQDYIKINIQVRAVNLDYVKVDKLLVTGTSFTWTSDLAYTGADGSTVASGGSIIVSAANAARVGIIGTTVHVFENAAGGSPVNTFLGAPSTLPTNGQADYYLEKTGITISSIPLAPTTVVTSVDTLDSVEILTLGAEAGGYRKAAFDLLVWFEGADPDTYDAILKQKLNVVLSLEGFKN